MHDPAHRFIAGTVDCFGVDDALAVDLGGRDINGTVHSLFSRPVLVVDISDGRGVDVVADAADWTTEGRFDVVLCTEVFEHTPRWREIIATAHRVLNPGGLLIATCATFGRPEHGAASDKPLPGEFYENVNPAHLRSELLGWTYSMVRTADGMFSQDDLYAWAVK